MIHTLTKPSSFMTFYFADVPGCDIQPVMEVNLTDYEPIQIKIIEANRNMSVRHPYMIFHYYRTNSNEPWKGFEPSIKEIRIDDTNLEQVLIDFRQFTITVPVSKLDFHLSCYDDYLDIMNQIKKIRFEKSDKLI